MLQPEISLALPCYNEEANIRRVVEDSIAHLEQFGRPWEVIVIDNHSSDRTPEIVRGLMQQDGRIRLIVHEANRFYAGSCQTAVNEARGQYLAIMDSDCQFTIADLPKFLAKIETGDDLVFGWRRVRHDPLFRKLTSWVFNKLGWWYLGAQIHDLNVGLRVMNRRCIDAVYFEHRLNFANPELYVRAVKAGLKIGEVQIQHFERLEGAVCHNFAKSFTLFKNVNAYLTALRADLKSSASSKRTGSPDQTHDQDRKVA